MPFNSSGVFSRAYSWVADALAGINITASRMDADANDIANGLSQCITSNGTSTVSANIPFGGFRLTEVANGIAGTDVATVEQLTALIATGVGIISNIAALRSLSHLTSPAIVTTEGYYTSGDGGSGAYVYIPTDGTSADNGGTVIIDSNFGRWHLVVASNIINAAQFGVATSQPDNAPMLLAAITFLAPTGGTLILPAGVFNVSTLAFTYSGTLGTGENYPINIRGQGKYTTQLKKTGTDANPVLNLTAAVAGTPQNIHSEFSDFSIVGNGWNGPALQMNSLARFTLTRMNMGGASVGFNNVSCLLFDVNECDITGNNTGYKSREVSGLWCNSINFNGGSIVYNGNTTAATSGAAGYGFDIGGSNWFKVYGTDIERNGTSGNATSGDVIIQNDCGNELTPNYAEIGFYNCWFEVNQGQGFTVATNPALSLTLQDCLHYFNGSSTDHNIGAIRQVTMRNVKGTSNSAISGGASSVVEHCWFNLFTSTSTTQTFYDTTINGTLYPFYATNATLGGLYYDINGITHATNTGVYNITYSATMATNTLIGQTFVITATNATAFTISNPTNMVTGQWLTYTIRNTSGGALGTATWGSAFKMATWTQPANTYSRTITFQYDGTNWVERSRTPADVPN